jgi:hypothetical protein
MRKMLLIGCALLFVFCSKRQTTVETEGLEEVIVFGEEETSYVSAEPVLPAEEEVVAVPPIEEEPTMPPEEEVTALPPIEEEPIMPPTEEVALAPPPVEEEITTPPPIEEEPIMPAPVIEETPPPFVEEPYMPPTVTPTAPPTPPPASILGFRIQIFASSTQKNASRVANDAKSVFTENVYVQHVAPYYKVRIGDFITREEAYAMQQRALQKGYRGAFIVETMIAP